MKIIRSLEELLKNNVLLVILVVTTLVLTIVNYIPSTYLTGWDTLHPEFNYSLYWQRIIDGVWQEHQGLGAVATQAHASEISRIIIIQLADIFLKTQQVRYFWAFFMLVLGPLGVYFFVKYILEKTLSHRLAHFSQLQSFAPQKLAAFLAGLFYLLNLATLQQYYVPLEMFLTHFGFLGFVFLYATRYLEERRVKDLFIFGLLNFFASSQAHTSTLFFAFLITFAFYVFLIFLHDIYRTKSLFKAIKAPFLIALVLTFTNLFWLMPNAYFALEHGDEVQQSKIHYLFSGEAFLQNKNFGKIEDVSIMRSFLFKWGEHVGNAQFGDLLNEWKVHQRNPLVLPLGYFFAVLALLGLLISIAKRNRYGWAMFAVLFIPIFFIINQNPPFTRAFIYFQEAVPLFKEAFRFPFTKFSLLLAFAMAVYFGFFFVHLSLFFAKIFKNDRSLKILNAFFAVFVGLSLCFYMFPAFNGYLISPSMKVEIPQRYFDMFEYFDSQKEFGRVADFPIHSFWGWTYHNWPETKGIGYQGAGFLWFGIKQPLLNREFDRWGLDNENYYNEMSHAVYSQDTELFESLLEKYKIKWLILDESIIFVGGDQKAVFLKQLKELFDSSSKLEKARDFGNGLYVYKAKSNFSETEVISSYAVSQINISKEKTDPAYSHFKNYVSTESGYIYPFSGITEVDESIKQSVLTSDSSNVYFNLPKKDDKVEVGNVAQNINVQVFLTASNPQQATIALYEPVSKKSEFVSFEMPFEEGILKIGQSFLEVPKDAQTGDSPVRLGSALLDATTTYFTLYRSGESSSATLQVNKFAVLEPCSGLEERASYSVEKRSDGFILKSQNLAGCVTVPVEDVFVPYAQVQNGSVLLRISYDYENLGSDPYLCVLDPVTGLCSYDFVDRSGSIFKLISLKTYQNHYLRFFSNLERIEGEQGVYYKNLKVEQIGFVGRVPFSSQKFLSKEISGSLLEPSGDRINFNKRYEFTFNMGTYTKNNPVECGYDRLGKDQVYTKTQNYIRYTTFEGVLCDSIPFTNLSHQNGYVLEIISRNIKGLPLRICLTNEFSKRCDIYTTLADSDEFVKQFFIIPPIDQHYGYTLNISNLVFDEEGTQNDLAYVAMTPFSYELIKSVRYPPKQEFNKGTLLVHNQAYEPGWLALCGLKPCNAQHVKVNNWANGWIFDSAASTTGIDSNSAVNGLSTVEPQRDLTNVKVLFWPQLLEYFGLGLLFGTLGVLFVFYKREKSESSEKTS